MVGDGAKAGVVGEGEEIVTVEVGVETLGDDVVTPVLMGMGVAVAGAGRPSVV